MLLKLLCVCFTVITVIAQRTSHEQASVLLLHVAVHTRQSAAVLSAIRIAPVTLLRLLLLLMRSPQVEVAKDLVAKGFRCSDDRVFADQVDKCIQMYETQVHTRYCSNPCVT
jgi:hypothetical protein